MFDFIRAFKYHFLQKSRQAICVLDASDKVIFVNKKYKFMTNSRALSVFDFLSETQEHAKQLYCLKNKTLAEGIGTSIINKKIITVEKKGNNTIWFINKLKIINEKIDIEFLPIPVVELNEKNIIKSSNTLFNNLFIENKAVFLNFFKELSTTKVCSELQLKHKIVKVFIKHAEENNIILSFIEITKQKVLEQEVGHNQKMQAVGQLAGGIAHDFNNILTAIIMSCDFLLASHRSSDPSHPDLLTIKQNANRAASLVQQLLAFSRRQTLQVDICNVADIVAETRSLLERMMGTNIKLKMHYTYDVWQTKLDKASFQRVLVNLLINAKDAIGDNQGTIDINVKNVFAHEISKFNFDELENTNYVLVQVSDTGPGIAESIRDKIFEPFFTTKEVGKGTGLGLAMSYGIVKQQGGFIKCNSVIGEGTEFLIFLPAVKDVSVVKIKEVEQQKTEDLSGTATILLVDDEDIVRKSCARALKSRGYEILEALNGQEAFTLFKTNKDKINLIISDVIMPVMDGPSFYAEIQKTGVKTKFVFISGYTKEAFTEKYNLENNDFYFLAKPISLKELAASIKKIQETT